VAATVIADICLCMMLFAFLYCKYGMKLISKNSIWGMGLAGSLIMGVYVWRMYALAEACMDNTRRGAGILCGIVITAAILYVVVLWFGLFMGRKFGGKANGQR